MRNIFFASIVLGATLLSACSKGAPKAGLKTEVDTLSYEIGLVMSPGDQLSRYLTYSGSDSAYIDDYLKGFTNGYRSGDDKKQMAYYIGVMQGMQSKVQMAQIEKQIFEGDSTKKVSSKNFVAGYADAAKGMPVLKNEKGELVTKEEANQAILEYMFSKYREESEAFMADLAKQDGVEALSDGIYYKEITPSESTVRATAESIVKVKYEGRLVDGNVFDSSRRHEDEIAQFSLRNVIEGWKIAIPQMPVGATWEIYIPWDLAYGSTGTGSIPPYSALIFEITLVEVVE